MKRFLSSIFVALFAVVLVPGLTAVANAKTTCPAGETYVKAYTKADGTKVSGYCKSSGKAMASTAAMKASEPAMAPAASTKATSMPASMKGAESMKTATTSTAPSASGTCPPGKTYVHGYTKSNGTKVAAYCRNKPSK